MLKQHARDIKTSQNSLKYVSNLTALAEDAFHQKHDFSFVETKIIGKEKA